MELLSKTIITWLGPQCLPIDIDLCFIRFLLSNWSWEEINSHIPPSPKVAPLVLPEPRLPLFDSSILNLKAHAKGGVQFTCFCLLEHLPLMHTSSHSTWNLWTLAWWGPTSWILILAIIAAANSLPYPFLALKILFFFSSLSIMTTWEQISTTSL